VALDGLGVAAEVLAAQRDVEAHLHLAARSVSETGTGMVVLSRRLL
jgi:hypothetical protein